MTAPPATLHAAPEIRSAWIARVRKDIEFPWGSPTGWVQRYRATAPPPGAVQGLGFRISDGWVGVHVCEHGYLRLPHWTHPNAGMTPEKTDRQAAGVAIMRHEKLEDIPGPEHESQFWRVRDLFRVAELLESIPATLEQVVLKEGVRSIMEIPPAWRMNLDRLHHRLGRVARSSHVSTQEGILWPLYAWQMVRMARSIVAEGVFDDCPWTAD